MNEDITARLERLYVQNGTDYVQEAAQTIRTLRDDGIQMQKCIEELQEQIAQLHEALERRKTDTLQPDPEDIFIAALKTDSTLASRVACTRDGDIVNINLTWKGELPSATAKKLLTEWLITKG